MEEDSAKNDKLRMRKMKSDTLVLAKRRKKRETIEEDAGKALFTEYKKKMEEQFRSKEEDMKIKMEEEIRKREEELKRTQSIYPNEWEPQEKNCELKSVTKDSEEWTRVANKVKESLSNATIATIERIQNRWLYQRYANERKRIEEKNGSNNEAELFHGTSSVLPKLIYNGEEGFDMRFSKQGLWGSGIYFAERAMYSNDYAHEPPETANKKQFFLARVIVGTACEKGEVVERELKMPPLKQTECGISNLKFDDERYDSVKAYANFSQIYIVYNNMRAYPSYLITYE